MICAGLDVGSVATKAVVYHVEEKRVLGRHIAPTGWDALEAAQGVLAAACAKARTAPSELARIVGTGYGRVSLPFAHKTVTEITCHARGAAELFPGTGIVLDIGGQDSKVISIEEQPAPNGKTGQVRDFVMNDKCAAGTGRFLQVLSGILDMPLEALGQAASVGRPVAISSMCAVFAETEIVGLLARRTPPEDIAAGVFLSIVRRTVALAKRIPMHGHCVFSGGLARSPAFRDLLSRELDVPVHVPEEPQSMGAFGAALIAAEHVSLSDAQPAATNDDTRSEQ
jgi:predicted CoA-substrate-specific enzyme activase